MSIPSSLAYGAIELLFWTKLLLRNVFHSSPPLSCLGINSASWFAIVTFGSSVSLQPATEQGSESIEAQKKEHRSCYIRNVDGHPQTGRRTVHKYLLVPRMDS